MREELKVLSSRNHQMLQVIFTIYQYTYTVLHAELGAREVQNENFQNLGGGESILGEAFLYPALHMYIIVTYMYEKSNIPFSYMLRICGNAYSVKKPIIPGFG